MPCFTRRYVVRKKQSVLYHWGDHTCPLKPVIFKPVEDVRRTVSENLTLTPSQIRSNIMLSMMKQRRRTGLQLKRRLLKHKKWISNEKTWKNNKPHGHNFEGIAHFKQPSDSRDPYYIYKLNDRRGNPNKPSFIFIKQVKKASFALNMDKKRSHLK